MYIKDGIVCSEVNVVQLNTTAIEQIWRVVQFGEESFLIGCIYRPHDLNDESINDYTASITTAHNSLHSLKCSSMLIYGDFNFSNTTYESIDVGGGVATVAHINNERPCDIKFQTCLNECHLTQLVTFPTYRTNRNLEAISTLDLIITDEPDRAIVIQKGDSFCHTPMGQTHFLITGQFACSGQDKNLNEPAHSRFIWSKANYPTLSTQIISYDWESLFVGFSADENYQVLLDKYKEAQQMHVPSTSNPFVKKKEPWVTSEVTEAVEEKRVLWAKCISSGRNTHETIRKLHLKSCKRVSKVVRSAVVKYEESLINAFKYDPKILHSHVQSKQRVKDIVRSVETPDGSITTDQKLICSTINDYFQSVFAPEVTTPMPAFERRTQSNIDISSNIFSTDTVAHHLSYLDESKSMGFDDIHPRTLKKCAAAFSIPLSLIYKKSFEMGIVPNIWKKSNITPIFKKGSKLQPSNYRPVSLTSVPCKVMESLVHEQIMKHCIENNLISKTQHGFVHRKGCVTNLLEARDISTEAVHQGCGVDVVYTDFSKAFDKVPHKGLIYKLRAYGIEGEILYWITGWLVDRLQRVVINGTTSEWKLVTSGIPQGSVLGPLLFVLFINDLSDNIIHHIKLYADDSKIIAIIESDADAENLQADIDKAVEWSNTWCMPFNEKKCTVMHIGRPN